MYIIVYFLMLSNVTSDQKPYPINIPVMDWMSFRGRWFEETETWDLTQSILPAEKIISSIVAATQLAFKITIPDFNQSLFCYQIFPMKD